VAHSPVRPLAPSTGVRACMAARCRTHTHPPCSPTPCAPSVCVHLARTAALLGLPARPHCPHALQHARTATQHTGARSTAHHVAVLQTTCRVAASSTTHRVALRLPIKLDSARAQVLVRTVGVLDGPLPQRAHRAVQELLRP